MEDFSPPECPEVGINVVEDHGGPGPEPFQLEPLAPDPVFAQSRSSLSRGSAREDGGRENA